jgi:chromosome segregation ATPase
MSQATESKKFPLRPDKTIDWLNKSRDEWKNKTFSTKSELKVAKQAQKRARKSREEWKEQCRQLEQDRERALGERDEEIAILKAKLHELENENIDLKKKYSLHLMTQK